MSKQTSILDLPLEDLKGIMISNTYPEGVTLDGIVTSPYFEKVFKLKEKPAELAAYLVKVLFPPEKKTEHPKEPKPPREVKYHSTIPKELRERKLQVEEGRLRLKETKAHGITKINGSLDSIIKALKVLNHKLDRQEKILKVLITHLLKDKAREDET